MTNEEIPVLKTAIKEFGHANQILKTFEELGELTDALAKYHRDGRADKAQVISELADVSIMVDQMAIEFGLSDFNAERARKLQRLKNRLKI